MKGKKILIVGGIVIAMIACVVVVNKNKPKEVDTIAGDKSGPRVQVERVVKDNISTKISSSGTLESVSTKTVYLEYGGTIATINKKEGDLVKQGEIILTLSNDDIVSTQRKISDSQAQLSALQESLNSLEGKGSTQEVLTAESTLSQYKDTKAQTEDKISQEQTNLSNLNDNMTDLKNQLALTSELYDQGLESKDNKDKLETKIKELQQSIDQSEKNIQLYKSSLTTLEKEVAATQYSLDVLLNKEEDTTKRSQIADVKSQIQAVESSIADSKDQLEKMATKVIAPISGVITEVPENEGALLNKGDAVATIVDADHLKVECEISPYYAPDLKNGLAAEVKYTGSKTIEVAGSITKVAAMAKVEKTTNGETTFLPVEVSLEDTQGILKPGFSVDVKVITDTREGVCLVPLLATVEDDDVSYVYVVHEDGTLEKREVVEGLSDSLNIEVSGVEEGELVVDSPSDYLDGVQSVSYEKLGDE